MSYLTKLRERAAEVGNIVCVGLDPALDKIPLQGNPEEVIAKFYTDMLQAMKSEGVQPAIVKPNIAFYEQYGFEGLRALKKIVSVCKEIKMPVLVDAKRGDIGNTSAAYAKAIFDWWDFDALTVAPYMGHDSVGPFLEYCQKGKGVYILNRTSNKGAVDMQNLLVDGKPVYRKVSEKVVEWAQDGVCVVVGATYPEELEEISTFFVQSGKTIPFLIPGVGAQGGSATEIIHRLKKSGNEIAIHRINSSCGINYAYQKMDTTDYAGAAVKALRELHQETKV